MGTEPAIIEISSDDEDFGPHKSCNPADWLDKLLDCMDERKDFEDVMVLDGISSAPAIQKKSTAAPRVVKGVVKDDLDDDCLVLEGDPDKPVAIVDDKRGGDGDDLLIVGQKGQIACRDYPHPRYLCANFPFKSSPHEKTCALCHCYVCDTPAPCKYWGNGVSSSDHCHSTDKEARWKAERKDFKRRTMPFPVSLPVPIQSLKSNSLRACSATRVSHQVSISRRSDLLSSAFSSRGQRLGHHLAKSPPLATEMHCMQKEKRGGGALADRILPCDPMFKRARSVRSGLVSPIAPRLDGILPGQNQMYRAAPQISESPASMPTVDTSKSWEEILADVASELGVLDATKECTAAVQQPEAVSSQAAAFFPCLPQLDSHQNMDIYPCSAPATTEPYLPNYVSSWLNDTTAQDAQLLTPQLFDPLVTQSISASGENHLDSIFSSLAQDTEAAIKVFPSQLDPVSMPPL